MHEFLHIFASIDILISVTYNQTEKRAIMQSKSHHVTSHHVGKLCQTCINREACQKSWLTVGTVVLIGNFHYATFLFFFSLLFFTFSCNVFRPPSQPSVLNPTVTKENSTTILAVV